MSTYEATIVMRFDNFDNEKEIMESITSIHADGIDAFRKNYADLMGKTVVIKDVVTAIVIPPFAQIDKMMMAKLLSQHMSVADRQDGIYESRGGKQYAAGYALNKLIIPAFKQLHVDQLFELYSKAGSPQVLVQDILGNVFINFEEVPSSLLDLADFTMRFVEHYKAHEAELEQYLIVAPISEVVEVPPEIEEE
jgi:hypothetical protein